MKLRHSNGVTITLTVNGIFNLVAMIERPLNVTFMLWGPLSTYWIMILAIH